MKKFTFRWLLSLLMVSTFAFTINAQTNNISGSNIVCNSYYHSDSTIEMNFTISRISPDAEWIRFVGISFPQGVTPDTASAIGPVPVNPIQGQIVSWGDSASTGWGSIQNQSYNFTVTLSFEASLTGDQIASYYLEGDDYGSDPHFVDDTFIIYEVPACLEPSILDVSGITSNSVVLSWLQADEETDWNVVVDTLGFNPDSATAVAVSDTSYEVTGLEPNTTYEFYVQSDCQEDSLSRWSPSFQFTTACVALTPNYVQDFSAGVGIYDECWEKATGPLSGSTGEPGTGDWSTWGTTASIGLANYMSDDSWLKTPHFDLTGGNYSVVFDLKSNYWGSTFDDDDNFSFLFTMDGGDTWIPMKSWTVSSPVPGEYEHFAFDLTVLSSQPDVQFAFFASEGTTSDNGSYTVYVDNFEVRPGLTGTDFLTYTFPEAVEPGVVDTVNHTITIEVGNAVELSALTAEYTLSQYATVELSDSIQKSGVTTNDFTNPVTYKVYSENGSISQDWVVTVTQAEIHSDANFVAFSFPEQTGDAVIDTVNNTVTISVNFMADVTNLTPTYTLSYGATTADEFTDFTNPVVYSVLAEDGVTTKDWTVTVTQEDVPAGLECATALEYGNINDPHMTAVLQAGLNWWYEVTLDQTYANVEFSLCGSDFDTRLAIFDDCPDSTIYGSAIGSAFNNPLGYIGFDEDGCETGDFGTGHTYASTHTFDTLPAGTYYFVAYGYSNNSAGNLRIEVTGEDCTKPVGVEASGLTATTATLSWTELLSSTSWVLKVDTASINPDTNIVAVFNDTVSGTPSQVLTGLEEETTYYVYLQSTCGSGWTNEFTFTTPSACPQQENLMASNITQDAADISWEAYGMTEWSIKVSTTSIDPATEDGDVLSNETITDNPYSLTGLTPETNYYVYVQASCGSDWSSEYVFQTEECSALGGIMASNITQNSAVISWSDALSQEWVLKVASDTIDPATEPGDIFDATISTDTAQELTGLQPGTVYYVYMEATCGGGWTSEYTFSTTCEVLTTLPWTETFEDDSDTRVCWSQEYVVSDHDWTISSSGTSAYEGTNSAVFTGSGSGPHITKFITPSFDLSGGSAYQLKFYYKQAVWASDQNTLKVFYRTDAASEWVELAEYTDNISSWTEETLVLPNLSANYQIAFEGTDNYGYANRLDNVTIEEYAPTTFVDLALEGPMSESACSYTDAETVNVRIENVGDEVVASGIVVGFTMVSGNDTLLAEDLTIDTDLNNGDVWEGTTTGTIDLSASGTVDFEATITYGGDTVVDNNSIAVSYTHFEQTVGFQDAVNDTITTSELPYNIMAEVALDPMPTNVTTTYLWNDGSVSSSLSANASGWYILTVTTGECVTTDSVYVNSTVGVKAIQTADLSIYPNPTTGKFNLVLDLNADKMVNLEVVNALGQVVERLNSVKSNQTVTMDLSNEATGMYYVRVFTNNQVVVKKVNVQR